MMPWSGLRCPADHHGALDRERKCLGEIGAALQEDLPGGLDLEGAKEGCPLVEEGHGPVLQQIHDEAGHEDAVLLDLAGEVAVMCLKADVVHALGVGPWVPFGSYGVGALSPSGFASSFRL